MEPNIWGPGAWTFLHSVCLNYPNNPNNYDKKYYKDFFYLLSNILPCEVCRKNLKKHMAEVPINNYLLNKVTLNQWLVKIHNMTNEQLGKEQISYDKFLEIYTEKYKNKTESVTYIKNKLTTQLNIIRFLLLCIIILILIIIFFIKNFYSKSIN